MEENKNREDKKKYKGLKIGALVVTILLLVLLTIYLFPMARNLFDEQGREVFKEEIQSSGVRGIFILLGLQGVQILLPILPGEPIEILAGMCYGPIRWNNIFNSICTYNNNINIFHSKKIRKRLCIWSL